MVYSTFRTLEGGSDDDGSIERTRMAAVCDNREEKKECSPCIEGKDRSIVRQEGTIPKLHSSYPSSEEGELLLKIYNGHIEKLPEPCVQTSRKGLGTDNTYGRDDQYRTLDESGAEGLSLMCEGSSHHGTAL
jgi:hypothetical protein